MEKRKSTPVSILIYQDQKEWLSKHQEYNLSGLVREMLDEKMKHWREFQNIKKTLDELKGGM
jgi:hypothetical protein